MQREDLNKNKRKKIKLTDTYTYKNSTKFLDKLMQKQDLNKRRNALNKITNNITITTLTLKKENKTDEPENKYVKVKISSNLP